MPKEKCHFCNAVTYHTFMYTIQRTQHKKYKNDLSVCSFHFDRLYDMAYIVGNEVSYLSQSQRELVAIKRLERDLKIKNRIQWKESKRV